MNMPIRSVITVVKSCVLLMCLIVQMSANPLFFFGVPIVVHYLFILIVYMIFLKDWYWALGCFFVGTILITQLSEISSIPLTASYALGTMLFLFLTDFLFKSRSAVVLTINITLSVIAVLCTYQLLSHVFTQPERALFSQSIAWKLLLSIGVHCMITFFTGFFVIFIDQLLRKRGVYGT